MIALALVYVRLLLKSTLLVFTLPFQFGYILISSYLLWNADGLNDMGDRVQAMNTSVRGVRNMIRSIADMERSSRLKLLLLIPYHVSCGINTAFWILYLVKTIFHDDISFLAAAYALFLSYLFSLMYTLTVKTITPNLNHNFHILVGGISTMCLGIFALSVDGFTEHKTHEDYRIVVVFASLYGISMSVYENNMRAEVANLLQHYEVLAYSVTSFAKSIAAGVCLVTSTWVLNKGQENATGLGLEVQLVVSSFVGVVGFIFAVMLDRQSNSSPVVVEHLEEKLLRESERNSIIEDCDSMYSPHNSMNRYDFLRLDKKNEFYSLGKSDTNSNHSSHTCAEELGGNIIHFENENITKETAICNVGEGNEAEEEEEEASAESSSVAEDEFFVPDYF